MVFRSGDTLKRRRITAQDIIITLMSALRDGVPVISMMDCFIIAFGREFTDKRTQGRL